MIEPDESVETAARGGVATLFLTFGLSSGLVVVLGLVLALVEGRVSAEHPWPRPALLHDVLALESEGVIGLGLVLLLLLPIVRNVSVVYVLLRRRQRPAALLALVGVAALLLLYAFLSLRDLLASAA